MGCDNSTKRLNRVKISFQRCNGGDNFWNIFAQNIIFQVLLQFPGKAHSRRNESKNQSLLSLRGHLETDGLGRTSHGSLRNFSNATRSFVRSNTQAGSRAWGRFHKDAAYILLVSSYKLKSCLRYSQQNKWFPINAETKDFSLSSLLAEQQPKFKFRITLKLNRAGMRLGLESQAQKLPILGPMSLLSLWKSLLL